MTEETEWSNEVMSRTITETYLLAAARGVQAFSHSSRCEVSAASLEERAVVSVVVQLRAGRLALVWDDAAIDTSNKFRIEISADLKEGQSCYTLLFGNVSRQSPINVDMERTQIIAVRKEKTGVRWWINGDECDAVAPGTLVTENEDKDDPIKERMKSRMSSRNSSVRSQQNEAVDVRVDMVHLGRSVLEVEGILSEHHRHHFFDGNLAELLAYRAALSRQVLSSAAARGLTPLLKGAHR
eukprot:753777-Hanusia_phi.AAC.7